MEEDSSRGSDSSRCCMLQYGVCEVHAVPQQHKFGRDSTYHSSQDKADMHAQPHVRSAVF